MAKNEQSPQDRKVFDWIPARDGTHLEIYSNFTNASWTLFDVRVKLGQLIPSGQGMRDFVIEERAAVTFSWPQVKNLRDLLSKLIASYEGVNGEIKPLKLPPDPTA